MIPIIQKKIIEDRKWISEIELLDMIAVAESTPGPISVNLATFVGYKVGGVIGAFFATFGLALPSFVIIFIISFFYEEFMKITMIQNAFKGLKVGVIILLINAVFKLKKSVKFNTVSWICFTLTVILMVSFSLFEITIPSVSLIFIGTGLLLGVVLELINSFSKKGGKN